MKGHLLLLREDTSWINILKCNTCFLHENALAPGLSIVFGETKIPYIDRSLAFFFIISNLAFVYMCVFIF